MPELTLQHHTTLPALGPEWRKNKLESCVPVNTKEHPGGSSSPRTHISHQSHTVCSLESSDLQGSFDRKSCQLRSYLDQCGVWEFSKPHQQDTRQIILGPAVKYYLRGSWPSSFRTSKGLNDGQRQHTLGPWDPLTVALPIYQDIVNHSSIWAMHPFGAGGSRHLTCHRPRAGSWVSWCSVCICEIKMKHWGYIC